MTDGDPTRAGQPFTSRAASPPSLDAPAELTEDGKRLKWLADNYEGVDFEYGDPDNPLMVLVIRIPEGEGVRVTSHFIDTIDALRKVAENPQTLQTQE